MKNSVTKDFMVIVRKNVIALMANVIQKLANVCAMLVGKVRCCMFLVFLMTTTKKMWKNEKENANIDGFYCGGFFRSSL